MNAKYIILKKNFAAIMFDPSIEHIEAAAQFGGADAVFSAGFFSLIFEGADVKVLCYGGSTSLGGIMSNAKIDSERIKRVLDS